MSVIRSDLDLNATNLTSEYGKAKDSESNLLLAKGKGIDSDITQEKNITQQIDGNKSVDNLDEKQPLTSEQLEKVAQQLQEFVGEMNRGLEFTVDKDSGRDVIKIIDKASGDLIKQYPSEEVLTLVAKLSDMVGGFIDAKV